MYYGFQVHLLNKNYLLPQPLLFLVNEELSEYYNRGISEHCQTSLRELFRKNSNRSFASSHVKSIFLK